MASPATVVINNRLGIGIITHVKEERWVDDGGRALNEQLIKAGDSPKFHVQAKTGHHGELTVLLLSGINRKQLGVLKINSIKDPQDGHGLEATSETPDLQITAVGHRSTPGAPDLRRIEVTLVDAGVGTLTYSQISMKASHNSYQRDESFIDQIRWNATNNYDCGCGGVELDISQSDDGTAWSVGHMPGYEEHYRQLSGFLSDLSAYAKGDPQHDVITLHLDLKHTATKTFPAQLDEYIRSRLPEGSVYTPGELMGREPTLAKGAQVNGWPTINALRGKFIICVTGDKDRKKTYAETDPKQRLCFADKDISADETPKDDHRVFFNVHIFHSDRDKWMKTFRDSAGKPEVITRAYEANSEDNWNDCLNSGCSLIATNKIKGHTWARVGAQRFAKKVPLV